MCTILKEWQPLNGRLVIENIYGDRIANIFRKAWSPVFLYNLFIDGVKTQETSKSTLIKNYNWQFVFQLAKYTFRVQKTQLFIQKSISLKNLFLLLEKRHH